MVSPLGGASIPERGTYITVDFRATWIANCLSRRLLGDDDGESGGCRRSMATHSLAQFAPRGERPSPLTSRGGDETLDRMER